MKLFLKIFGAIVALIVIFIIALNFYLTDERLKEIIMPRLNEMAGREIQVERISYTLFRTFPSFGLVIEKLDVPDTENEVDAGGRDGFTAQASERRSLASVEELLLTVELIPLIRGNVNVSRLDVTKPVFNYVVYEDGRTNLDSLLDFMEDEEEEVTEAQATTAIELELIRVREGRITYTDHQTNSFVSLRDFDSDISVSYDELLTTDVEATVGGLSVRFDGEQMLSDLPFSLRQRSVIDLENERVDIETGKLTIRGLELDMEGMIAEYTSDAVLLELSLNSSSDDFAALLELVPDSYKDQLEGVSTGGSLVLNANISGRLGEDMIPDFEAVLGVEDGFLQYPGVDSPIEEINIRIDARNEIVRIERFSARADVNSLSASGLINNPLEDDADFDFNFDMDLDLATIKNFYPLDDMELSGKLAMNGTTSGRVDDAENARFNAEVRLDDGFVRYVELDEPIRDMNVLLTATQDRVDITSFSARADRNTLSMNGHVLHPLDEERTRFNLEADIFMDLATLPRFYPVDTDTLDMRGEFTFKGTAAGRAADVENADINGTLSLRNGYIKYHHLPRPLDEIAFRADITRQRINIAQSSVKTGGNNFTASGRVSDYLTETPSVNLNVNGEFNLAELKDYVELEPYVSSISGIANMDLQINGPVTEPEKMRFNGLFRLSDFNVAGDSLPQPITDLRANLFFTEERAELRRLELKMGSSDFNFTGELRNYMRLLDEDPQQLATLNATFKSQKLHVDEIYEYVPPPEDAEPEPFPIELPKLIMNLDVEIGELIFLGVPITKISGQVATTDREIRINNAKAEVFEGKASGNVIWDVPQPDYTTLTFNGSLTDVQTADFFKQVQPAGRENLHEYFSGRFSASIEYKTEMDVYLDPVIPTMVSSGNFSMKQARMQNHPTQVRAAELLRTEELKNLRLDDLNSRFTIENSVMTLNDFNLTSREIGLELNGTQHLENEEIRYSAVVVLPGSLGRNIEPLITREGVNALKREDGKIPIPLRIRGTTDSPSVGLDNEEIQKRIQEFLRDSATDAVRNRLRDLFGG